ncbi:type I secretion C-terminal target domain-containing protein [Pelagibius sp. 7325]|uniref:type I secretion C-terminal target domain-containing protein n=1 Tax=Pelagibius sp. 7325 TaxID=3131994 RepID=UPI0030ED86CF
MTDDLTRGYEAQEANVTESAEAFTSGAEGTQGMGAEGTQTMGAVAVGQAGEAIVVSRPAPGQTVEIQVAPGQTYVLDFAPGDAQVQVQGDNFALAFDDNGDGTPDSQIVFLDLVDIVEAGDAPTFQIGGAEIGSDVLLGQALALAGQGEAPLDEVSAGPDATGGGASFYDDNLGGILDLLVAQGVIPPTALQFRLIELEDEITFLDPAEGEIALTFRTDTDGGEGAVNTWEGGFEDWQPNQDVCDPATFPMEILIGFTPADNEELVTLVISGIPAGATLFVGGVAVDTSSGSSPALTPADLASGLHLLPLEDSGDDIPLTVTATIVDPDSGASAVITGSATAIIDSVADKPAIGLDGEADGGEGGYGQGGGQGDYGDYYGGCEDDGCKIVVSKVVYKEDNGTDGGEGCCPTDGAPIFGAGFTAAVTDIDGSESLTKITVATREEYCPVDQNGLQVPLSATGDETATSFMIGGQVLVDGEFVEVAATFADGSTGFATATIEISGGVLTLTFAPELRVQEVDLSSGSDTPFQVRLPQHSDDDFQLNLEVTAQEFVIDGELTLDNNEATQQAVLNVEVQAVADGALLTATDESLSFAEDDESDPTKHGADSGETGLVIPLGSLGATLIDRDGSEGITQLKVSLVGADEFAEFVDAEGHPLVGPLQIEVAEGVFVTAGVDIDGSCLTLTFDGHETAGYDIDISGLVHVKLPVDDSSDFTVEFAATTTEVNTEGAVACESRTTETSFEVQVAGVAGPAAISFGDYENLPGCGCRGQQVDGNTLTLSLFEDGVGSVHGQAGAGPLTVPVFFTAQPQDSDGSEKITKVILSLDGAPEGTAFVDGLGEVLEADDVIAGGVVSFAEGQLVLTFEPGVDAVDLAGLGVKLPLHADGDFTINITTTTTEYDDDGVGALVETHETDAAIVVKVDAVADAVTVAVDAVSASGDEAFAPGEAGTVKVNATFGDLDGSEAHTVTVKVPYGFTVTDTAGGTLDGNTVTWVVTGEANFEAVLQIAAKDDLALDKTVQWVAKAKAVEQATGDAECTTSNNTAVATAKDRVTLDPALPPKVAVMLHGKPLCIKEDGQGEFKVKVDAKGDDFISQIEVENLPGAEQGWTVSVVGNDGGSFDPVTGIYTTAGEPGSVTLTVTLAPPADSDVDVATVMGDDIIFTATAEDPDSGDTAASAPAVADVNVDAVADPVAVNITVNDDPADAGNQFAAGETGTVKVQASFGDAEDGSEQHTVTVFIPNGFTVGDLGGLPEGVSAVVDGGKVIFTLGSGVPTLDYSFAVTAPASGVFDGRPFVFAAEAKAKEIPTDAECSVLNNYALDYDAELVLGEAARQPCVGLQVEGAGAVKEDTTANVQVTASTTSLGDTLSQVVVAAPAGWVLNAGAGGQIASVAGDGTGTLTLTLNPGVTNFSGTIQATPPEDSDVDAVFTVTATAVDGLDSAEGSDDFPVTVDAILDHALDLGSDGSNSGAETVGAQTFALNLDSSVVNPFTGSGAGGADTDGSETTTVTLTLDEPLPVGAVLSSTGGTVTQDPSDLTGKTYIVSGVNLEAAVDGLQVQVPGGYDGTISGTITAESREANTPAGTVVGSGAEPDETDNAWSNSVDFTVTVRGGEVAPEAAIGLAGAAAAIKEDSENNVVAFSANAGDATDELTTVVIELPNVATGDLDIAQINADLGGNGTAMLSQSGSTAVITITFNDAADVQSFASSFTLDAPDEDSDVDLTGVKITANAKDSSDASETGSGGQTTSIVVDAVLDHALELGEDGVAGASESDTAQTIGLGLDATQVSAGFALSLAGGEDSDGSETTTVTLTLDAALPEGAVLSSTALGATVVGGPLVYTISGPDLAAAVDGLQVEVPGGYEGTISGTISTESREANTPAGTVAGSGAEPDETDNVVTDSVAFTVTVGGGGVDPSASIALAGGGDCIEEDSLGNVVEFTASSGNATDELTTVVIELPNVAEEDIDIAQITADLGTDGTATVTAPGGLTTITITFNDAADVQNFSSSFTLDAPLANSDVDLTGVTITATAQDKTDPSQTGTGGETIDIPVDAVVDGSEVEQTAPAVGDEDTEIALNLAIDLGGDSTTGPGESQGGTDKDGSESVTRLVVMLSVGTLMWDLPAAIAAPTEGPEGTWTFETSGADLADVQDLVASLSVTPPEDFNGDIDVTVTTTTAEAATEAGPNGASGQECDDGNNVDEDTYEFTVTVNPTVEPAPVLVVGENVDDIATEQTPHRVDETSEDPVAGEIVGNGGGDVLVGDVGGGALDGKIMNLALILDTSNSMEEEIEFNGVTMTRIEALDQAVESLLDKLTDTAGLTVRLHMVSFNSNVTGQDTFDIITNGVVNATALQAAKDFILDADDEPTDVAQGNTNYEAGFQAALGWFSDDANTLDNPDFNKTIFVSDGLPNRVYEGNSPTKVAVEGNTQRALDHVLGAFTHPGNPSKSDTVSEYDGLLGAFKGVNGTVDAIGINVDSDGIAVLSQVDEGEADSIAEGQELADVLDGLSQVTELAGVGDDVIVGNGGSDLIFGDAIFTDSLAVDQGLTMVPGSGWEVIQHLVNNTDFFDQDLGKSVTEEIMDFLRDPANLATYDLGRESVNSEGVGRTGGDDTISGGAGNDTIFGQEGADLIDGGSGADIIIGGTGNDTMTGGEGADTFVWTDQFIAGETDTVTDFSAADGDVLDLSAVLEGTDPTDGGAELQSYLNITYDGTDTTIAIDVNGDGSGTDVTIVCEGVNLTAGGVDQADIIQSLIDSGQLQAATV